MKNSIKIGNAGGFWGDDLDALRRQLVGGDLDYISIDYLAEITMSILRKQQLKNKDLGYVTDFVDQVDNVAELLEEKSVKLIANAGGLNPLECGKQILKRLTDKNISLKIGIVEGDNIIDKIDTLYPDSCEFTNMENGESFDSIKDNVISANVYLGVKPIIKALELGADIIICGRVTDTSITIAPMIYEFGWELNDWDKLASGLVAGHIIECGAQSAGGNFTDWEKIERWDNFGYPIVEVFPDSTFNVTKHENTGGLVSIDTVKEQLLYEMGDPAEYISPDVIADFRTIKLKEVEKNCINISGVKGRPSTHFSKISIAYNDGYTASSSIIISGEDALTKAEKFSEIFWDRLSIDFIKTNTEYVGYNACHMNLANEINPNEILLKFSVYDYSKEKILEFGKNIAPLILSCPPGVAVTGGRPRPQNVVAYWPSLIEKKYISTKVTLLSELGDPLQTLELEEVSGYENESDKLSINLLQEEFDYTEEEQIKVSFRDICLARSGDKGDMANIGVIARSPEIYSFIKKELTTNFMRNLFKEFCHGEVKRYEVENLHGLNFLLEESLDGGGTKSLMIDPQGKTFASAFLNQEVEVPKSLLQSIRE